MRELFKQLTDFGIMVKLYIIGNGFDIHHGIPSRYSNYRDWLERYDAGLLEGLRNYYDVDNKEWWNQFERELGYPDMSEYIDETAFENQPDFGSDEFRDRDYHAGQFAAENEIGSLVADIKRTFFDWVVSLPAPNSNKKIKMEKETAFFINFNYTDTLQKLYNVKPTDILFIHGNASSGSDLVLGHNRPYDELEAEYVPELLEPTDSLDGEELSEWYDDNYDTGEDYIHQSVREEVVSQVFSLRKDTENIIKRNRVIFEALRDVENVYIYGLSFSEVDEPYLDEIVNNLRIKTTKWLVSYYSTGDKEKAKQYFCKKNINEDLVKYVKLEDLMLLKQIEIQFE